MNKTISMPENYQSKLTHPLWQKKRLEILQRDQFTCQLCNDQESTLHVHHLKYVGDNPWDTPDPLLITVCQPCHTAEHIDREKFLQAFYLQITKQHYPAILLQNLMKVVQYGLKATGEAGLAKQIGTILSDDSIKAIRA